jgi:hypothetical protein
MTGVSPHSVGPPRYAICYGAGWKAAMTACAAGFKVIESEPAPTVV